MCSIPLVTGGLFLFDRMNPESYQLCEKLIPAAYVQQGLQARRSHENAIRHLLEQVRGLSQTDRQTLQNRSHTLRRRNLSCIVDYCEKFRSFCRENGRWKAGMTRALSSCCKNWLSWTATISPATVVSERGRREWLLVSCDNDISSEAM